MFTLPHMAAALSGGLLLPSHYPTGLLGWVDPRAGSFADGDAVAALTNRVTGSSLWTQATGSAKPAFRSSGINTKPAVQSTTDDFMDGAAAQGSWTQNTAAFSFAVLLQMTSTANGQTILIHSNTTTTVTRFSLATAAGALRIATRRVAADALATLDGAAPVLTPQIVVVSLDFTNGMQYIAVNGAEVSGALVSSGSSENIAASRVRRTCSLANTPAAFANAYTGFEGYWNALYRTADLAPMLRTWAKFAGISYNG